jgi:hypothetical protein
VNALDVVREAVREAVEQLVGLPGVRVGVGVYCGRHGYGHEVEASITFRVSATFPVDDSAGRDRGQQLAEDLRHQLLCSLREYADKHWRAQP